jgi:hypothetical protein
VKVSNTTATSVAVKPSATIDEAQHLKLVLQESDLGQKIMQKIDPKKL